MIPSHLRSGAFFQDCRGHPCVIIGPSKYEILGVSLLDGSIESCSVQNCVANSWKTLFKLVEWWLHENNEFMHTYNDDPVQKAFFVQWWGEEGWLKQKELAKLFVAKKEIFKREFNVEKGDGEYLPYNKDHVS